MSDRSILLENSSSIPANAYASPEIVGLNNFVDGRTNQTIEATSGTQQSSTTLSNPGGSNQQQRRAVSNPKTFMRARMAQ